jgi:hypothetical protein
MRKLLKTVVTLVVIVYAAKLAFETAGEWQREDRMRAMSDEGPLLNDLPEIARQVLVQEGAFVRELAMFSVKFPLEIARYLKIEPM